MPDPISRRTFLQAAGAALIARQACGQEDENPSGLVVGQSEAAAVGMQVLADGGNAVDAVVAAALTTCVVSIHNCGIGGYGGHAVIARPGGEVAAIDFNSAAPAAARADMFPPDEKGNVPGMANTYGWLAVGVPGTLAGLSLALNRFGTRKFASLVEPAIRCAREGIAVTPALARVIAAHRERLAADPGSARLLLPGGMPPMEGTKLRNPDLARLLERLAAEGSVASFYRGKIAEEMSRQLAHRGALVTEEDLAAYEALLVEPLSLEWNGARICTAPLTAGGLSVLQALATLKALKWETADAASPWTMQAWLEALRIAWHDRLALLGDPARQDVPVARVLSDDYAQSSAARVQKAVESGTIVAGNSDGRSAGGTIHLSAADANGIFVALTLTHGEAFGAQVTVEGLGLILGHGMSRFDPRPEHTNAPGPHKRPLNNMCPTVVLSGNRPVAALGAAGGRRIPNTLCRVLAELVGRARPLAEAAAAPRLHTEGEAAIRLASGWPAAVGEHFRRVGYTIQPGPAGASLQAVFRDEASSKLTSASG